MTNQEDSHLLNKTLVERGIYSDFNELIRHRTFVGKMTRELETLKSGIIKQIEVLEKNLYDEQHRIDTELDKICRHEWETTYVAYETYERTCKKCGRVHVKF